MIQEISKAKNNSGFCSKAQIEKLQKELNTVQNVLMKLQPLNPGKAFLQKAPLNVKCLQEWNLFFEFAFHNKSLLYLL